MIIIICAVADLLQPLNSQPQQSAPVTTPSSSTIAGLSASDKYAALASLDTALGGGGSAATVNWETGWNTSAAPSNLFGASSNSEVTANVNSTAGFPVNTNTTGIGFCVRFVIITCINFHFYGPSLLMTFIQVKVYSHTSDFPPC